MAGSAVGAVLFIWAIGALLGGNTAPSLRGAADGVPLATSAASASNPPSSNPPASGGLSGSPTSSVSPTPSVTVTTPTVTTVTTTRTTTTTTPAPLQACPDSVMRVTVTSNQPVYQVGDHPKLTLHIANGGPVPCVRDVSRQFRSIEIRSADGGTTLWSSSDCYTFTSHEIPTLQPNESLSYSVVWAGRTDAPGCPTAHRTTVPAGKYELVGKLGTITGPPTALTIN